MDGYFLWYCTCICNNW